MMEERARLLQFHGTEGSEGSNESDGSDKSDGSDPVWTDVTTFSLGADDIGATPHGRSWTPRCRKSTELLDYCHATFL